MGKSANEMVTATIGAADRQWLQEQRGATFEGERERERGGKRECEWEQEQLIERDEGKAYGRGDDMGKGREVGVGEQRGK